ncbi:MAG: putative sporulation protein YtxC [Clostridiales bacterium]|nr:putative sporulation protein YtxC [Clostridiales bacterium]HBM80704.1 putative sporulation protein YtxC [Clostridiaceae bacterium]
MVLLSVGYFTEGCDVYEKMDRLASYYKAKGIGMGLVENDSGNLHFIKCVIKDPGSEFNKKQFKDNFYIYAADIIYQMIIENFQVKLISKIIKENYCFLQDNEVSNIADSCIQVLKGLTPASGSEYIYYKNIKENTKEKLLQYFNESNEIILEGFVRFRMKNFRNEIEDLSDKIVEEYLVDREYNEFIKLLKYFVDIQESSIDIINIVVESDGNYSMYDGMRNEITKDILKNILNESSKSDIDSDDLLISSLITAAPKYIIFHNLYNIKNKDIIETIKNVFCERVKICTGCSLCIGKNPAHKY